MDTVLVTGGTGHLGRDIVELLKPHHQVRVLTRTPGSDADVEWFRGDLATGEGVPEAVSGSSVIVHAATSSPAARRGYLLPTDFWRSPPDVDVDGTNQLLQEAGWAGVNHFVYISIVGVDQPKVPYLRLKHTAEELVSTADVPWSILRATQFHWLLDRMLSSAARLPLLPLPTELTTQPVHSGDFASYVVDCVTEGPGRRRADFGGPEVLTFGSAVAEWQRSRGRSGRVLRVPAPPRLARSAANLTCPDGRRGSTTWAAWLAR